MAKGNCEGCACDRRGFKRECAAIGIFCPCWFCAVESGGWGLYEYSLWHPIGCFLIFGERAYG